MRHAALALILLAGLAACTPVQEPLGYATMPGYGVPQPVALPSGDGVTYAPAQPVAGPSRSAILHSPSVGAHLNTRSGHVTPTIGASMGRMRVSAYDSGASVGTYLGPFNLSAGF